ncbi:M14 family zinc carboxypeptidase [Natronorubrum halophilum]|uniref:M14 family zinc carboxypeptidase n=1 Tax=Natronorubrum halophilum TaxID=1702106 RepID=UPI0010C1C0E2|nr:M14 family zinc carboxypeptidase [Natronorubrum halophilum]
MARASIDTMTYEEAIGRIPDDPVPEFWVGGLKALEERLQALDRGSLTELAVSPGGRPIQQVTYGEFEDLESRANFNSAVASRDPTHYADTDERTKPVVFFIGPVHGHEVEGLTGLCNLLSIFETGRDLRGRAQPTLRELADECRIVVLPCGNPDGLARFKPDSLRGLTLADLKFWGQGTWADDSLIGWPDAKQQHPMTGDNVGFLGCYFNDDGVNPMHDEFFDPVGVEAPTILGTVRREAPDVTVSLHSHGYAPTLHRPKYVPLELQAASRSINRTYNALLADHDIPRLYPHDVAGESGRPPPYFNLVSAAYHISGTTGVLHECPHGLAGEEMCQLSHEGILDAQLTLYEAVLRHAIEPAEP